MSSGRDRSTSQRRGDAVVVASSTVASPVGELNSRKSLPPRSPALSRGLSPSAAALGSGSPMSPLSPVSPFSPSGRLAADRRPPRPKAGSRASSPFGVHTVLAASSVSVPCTLGQPRPLGRQPGETVSVTTTTKTTAPSTSLTSGSAVAAARTSGSAVAPGRLRQLTPTRPATDASSPKVMSGTVRQLTPTRGPDLSSSGLVAGTGNVRQLTPTRTVADSSCGSSQVTTVSGRSTIGTASSVATSSVRQSLTPTRSSVITTLHSPSAKDLNKFSPAARRVTPPRTMPTVPLSSSSSSVAAPPSGSRQANIRGQTPPPISTSVITAKSLKTSQSLAAPVVTRRLGSSAAVPATQRRELKILRTPATSSTACASATRLPIRRTRSLESSLDMHSRSMSPPGGGSQEEVRARPSQPSRFHSVPRLFSPGASWPRASSAPLSTARSAEDWAAEPFISHRKIQDNACKADEAEEPTSPQRIHKIERVSPMRSDARRPHSPAKADGSSSEPECSPEQSLTEAPGRPHRQDMEIINCDSSTASTNYQANILKQLISEAGCGNGDPSNEHLQKSLEDWMVRWEQSQQEHVLAADQQIRHLQHEVEQLRALKASVHAKDIAAAAEKK